MNELLRLQDLASYRILDTLPEKEFDEIVDLAAAICEMPVSIITLIDDKRQWFKAKVGTTVTETSREISFCLHTLDRPNELLVVDNTATDPRFKDNPLVTAEPHVRFYAGAPLTTPSGNVLGTLCVVDTKPHKLSADKRRALQILSRKAMEMLELRKENLLSRETQKKAEKVLQKLTDQAPGVIFQFEINPQGGQSFTFVSKGIEDIRPGVTAAMLRRQPELAFSNVHPRDRPLINACLMYANEHVTDWDLEFRVTDNDGGLRWHHGVAHPEKQDDGTIIWYGTIQDITASKTRQAALVNAIIDSEEKERKRLASELHDSFGQIMAAILFSLKRLRSSHPDSDYSEIIGLVNEGIAEYRTISHNIYPANIQELSLCDLISKKAAQLNEMTEAAVLFESDCRSDNPVADMAVKKDIYRTFQELTNNILKHAKATEIIIRISEAHGRFVMEISDNGIGFNPAEKDRSSGNGIGLASLNGRAELMGGHFDLRSAPGNGTTATLIVPLRIGIEQQDR